METRAILGLLALSLFCRDARASDEAENNLHLINSDAATGFAIYRMGEPDANDMKEMCKLGITEIAVLAGSAASVEEKLKAHCPTLKVVYNVDQNAKVPLTEDFLNWFDSWVQEAQQQGKKIAFRCSCGCHRTGRLAAYYQMKYDQMSAKDAIEVMNLLGKWMFLHPQLDDQVYALDDFIQGKACSQKAQHCVKPSEDLIETGLIEYGLTSDEY